MFSSPKDSFSVAALSGKPFFCFPRPRTSAPVKRVRWSTVGRGCRTDPPEASVATPRGSDIANDALPCRVMDFPADAAGLRVAGAGDQRPFRQIGTFPEVLRSTEEHNKAVFMDQVHSGTLPRSSK